jgi:hypothetical protein
MLYRHWFDSQTGPMTEGALISLEERVVVSYTVVILDDQGGRDDGAFCYLGGYLSMLSRWLTQYSRV